LKKGKWKLAGTKDPVCPVFVFCGNKNTGAATRLLQYKGVKKKLFNKADCRPNQAGRSLKTLFRDLRASEVIHFAKEYHRKVAPHRLNT